MILPTFVYKHVLLFACAAAYFTQPAKAESPDHFSDYDWASRRIDVQEGCEISANYAPPSAIDGICYSEVLITKKCPGEPGASEVGKKRYAAFIKNSDDACSDLCAVTDFFSLEIINNDPYFFRVLKSASSLLNREIESSFSGSSEISQSSIQEIKKAGMASFSGLRNAAETARGIDRYRLSFRLSSIGVAIVLEINEDGSEPAWGEVVP